MAKDKSKQRFWEENGRWKEWKSSDYRRRVTGAKEWEIVHHKDHDKSNNSKSNFKIERPKNWMTATWVHNQDHKEKSIKWGLARARQIKNGK